MSKLINKIYIIKCYRNKEKFLKLGYTKNKIKVRFNEFPYNYKTLRIIKSKDAELIETSIHRVLRHKRHKPLRRFVGNTECYPMSMFNEINRILNDACGIEHRPKRRPKLEYNHLNSRGQLDYVDLSMFKL